MAPARTQPGARAGSAPGPGLGSVRAQAVPRPSLGPARETCSFSVAHSEGVIVGVTGSYADVAASGSEVDLALSIQDHLKETNSAIAKEILDDFENKINNFKQVCPVEMLDKLENPITLKGSISKAV